MRGPQSFAQPGQIRKTPAVNPGPRLFGVVNRKRAAVQEGIYGTAKVTFTLESDAAAYTLIYDFNEIAEVGRFFFAAPM